MPGRFVNPVRLQSFNSGPRIFSSLLSLSVARLLPPPAAPALPPFATLPAVYSHAPPVTPPPCTHLQPRPVYSPPPPPPFASASFALRRPSPSHHPPSPRLRPSRLPPVLLTACLPSPRTSIAPSPPPHIAKPTAANLYVVGHRAPPP
ncbi:uncharacterized protein A4U43_C01F20230 [Asparagus officinalis]|uniref:Uncharacterized protein n=1 Tax=Asparagus officinalis TaxID=4686 RepID=A0A5P1FRL2_ASPOF|nr:uncharacterized protein A4U43_C01F20230 [Asparagus officinalis]